MRFRHLWVAVLSCALILSCNAIPAGAVEMQSSDTPILRVTERVNQSIAGNSIVSLDYWVSLDAGDTLGFNCTYTPRRASVDFGYIDSDSVFHYLNCTNGNFDKLFEVARLGQYKLAIRNNEDYAVTVTGTVRY